MKKTLGGIALGLLASLGLAVWAQQSGSGLPGGAVNSTQIKSSPTAFAGVGPGTSGQVLTSNGAGSPPSFQDGGTSFPLLAPNGSQAAPSYSFSGDTNTGIWRVSADVIGIGGGNSNDVNIGNGFTDINNALRANQTATFSGDPTVFDPGGGTDEMTLTSGLITNTARLVTMVSGTGGAGLNLPPGTAPSSPVDGDVWVTTTGLFARINGVTVGPFGAGGAASQDVQIYTSGSNSWTEPANAKTVEVLLVGGGGGGGGGANTTTNASGGGGGGAGGVSRYVFDAGVTSSLTVTVGAGGLGGGGAGLSNTPGTNGNPGGNTTFGTLLTATGGALGQGGQVAGNSTGGAGGVGNAGTGGAGAGGTTNVDGTSAAASTSIAGGGGGSGGGATVGTNRTGGNGGAGALFQSTPPAGGAGGTAPNNGSVGTANTTNSAKGGGGGGGGSGSNTGGSQAGSGAVGGIYGGGGGGGGSGQSGGGSPGGNGGNGGAGIAIVITSF